MNCLAGDPIPIRAPNRDCWNQRPVYEEQFVIPTKKGVGKISLHRTEQEKSCFATLKKKIYAYKGNFTKAGYFEKIVGIF